MSEPAEAIAAQQVLIPGCGGQSMGGAKSEPT